MKEPNKLREEWRNEFDCHLDQLDIPSEIREKMENWTPEKLKEDRRGLVKAVQKEMLRDENKKDVQSCPIHMIGERIAYNEGLMAGFDQVINLIEEE